MVINVNAKSNKGANKVFVLLMAISILFISLRLTPTILAIKQLAYSVLVPNLQISSDIFTKAGGFILNLSNIIKVNQENISLRNEIFELTQKLSDYQSVLDDNMRLRQLLKIQETKNVRPVFANIIIREPSQWYQWVIINKGSTDGIEKNAPVIAVLLNGDICVFGRIFEVYETTAKVALLTNSLISVPVQIKNVDVDCIAEGFNSHYLKLSYVPQTSNIKAGEQIVTSPLSDVFERGIKVGKITDVVKTDYGQYQDIIVEPYSQTQSIYEIAVLLEK